MSKRGDEIRSHIDGLINWHIDQYGDMPKYIHIFASQYDALVKERRMPRFDGYHRGVELKPHEQRISLVKEEGY